MPHSLLAKIWLRIAVAFPFRSIPSSGIPIGYRIFWILNMFILLMGEVHAPLSEYAKADKLCVMKSEILQGDSTDLLVQNFGFADGYKGGIAVVGADKYQNAEFALQHCALSHGLSAGLDGDTRGASG